jgi:hypothetical protein
VNNGQKLQERGLLATNPDGTSYRLPCGWDEDWVESLRLPSTPCSTSLRKEEGTRLDRRSPHDSAVFRLRQGPHEPCRDTVDGCR